ncbi:hypothetical protein FOZ63_031313 [Perkinsus olseni]|uniref:Uncharacterized protein n=1 Tax=Perkinsus olseni TaxID=32597 RepID=A0A7J6TCM1_PEROL|nr:hypothetical protein FOZ63_031313 [Perkinsus olseni]
MSTVTLRTPPEIQATDEILKRGLWDVTISTALRSEVEFSYVLEEVQNPAEIGLSYWDITTYLDTVESDSKKDAKLDAEGFEILGSIRVHSDSRIDPRVYGAKDSVIYFALRNELKKFAAECAWLTDAYDCDIGEFDVLFTDSDLIRAGSVLELHAPPGYVLKNETFVRLSGIVEEEGQHGLEPAPTGTSQYVYKILLSADITEDNEFAFTITADLPETHHSESRWLVQAVYDEVVVATNDFGFPGFALVGTLPFSVVPELQTPGAQIILRISFSLAAMLRGETYVSLEITAPLGFKFSSGSSCLKSSSTEGSGSVFGGCIGNNNVATLSTTRDILEAGQTVIEMVCVNPDVTPANNFWRLALFLDSDSSLYRNIQTEEGYEINAMEAEFRGNNRLGVRAPGFFTFVPSKEIIGPIQVDICDGIATPKFVSLGLILLQTPPLDSGYALKCTPLYRVGLPEPPECSDQTSLVESVITLFFSNVFIEQEVGFTFAVEVVNPGAPPIPDPDSGSSGNAFGLVVRDREGNTIDANMIIPGMELLNVPLVGFALAWDAVEAQSISRLQVVLKITRDMQPGEVTEIQIEAPQDVGFTAPSNVILSENLPASDVAPVSVAGNRLIIRLNRESESQTLVGTTEMNGLREGTVLITFAVKNPSRLPNANYWILKMFGISMAKNLRCPMRLLALQGRLRELTQ